MLGLIARRLAQLPLILTAVFLATLALAWAVPGNPLERGERRPPPEVEAAMRAQYRLDSFWAFAGSYADSASGLRALRLGRGEGPTRRPVFDFGPSLQYRDQRVNDILADFLPVSITLGAASLLIALALGIGAGVLGALRPGGVLDAATLVLSLVGVSVPNFVIGTGLLALFALGLGWPPVGEWGRARDLLLPAFTLSLPFAAYIARLVRVGMIEALRADFIRTARAAGLPEWRVVLVYALKNALLPVVSYLGPAAAGAMTGSFVVEVVFSVPGLGQHFVNAVQNKDLFLLMGVVLVYATMLVVFNLVVDVMARWVDPRTG
ncbi:MAG: ABC transporter [Phycisphaerae bacterium]|nr:MAG: ABC transporter [Phycisphaerae bacterium]